MSAKIADRRISNTKYILYILLLQGNTQRFIYLDES